jgi:HK97 family phage prohead protease
MTTTPALAPVARTVTHVYANRLQVRHADDGPEGDGRTIFGLAVPYDVELDVSDWWDDYTEVFRKGSFAKTIRDRSHPVPLLVSHERRALPIGASVDLSEEEDGLHAAFHLAATPKADEVLALVAEDAISGLSIGFEPVTTNITAGPQRTPPSLRDLHERSAVKLHEVSVCNFPAYEDAGVHGVRAAQARHPTMAALGAERARLHAVRSGLVDRFGRVERIRIHTR